MFASFHKPAKRKMIPNTVLLFIMIVYFELILTCSFFFEYAAKLFYSYNTGK